MKANLSALFSFAALATLATCASAADTIQITTELTRNGEIVDNFSAQTQNRVTQPHRSITLIPYTKSVTDRKAKMAQLEVGTTSSVTPMITSEGKILLKFDVNHVHLNKMERAEQGKLHIDLPQTEIVRLASNVEVASGEKVKFKTMDNGVEYIYTLSATKQ